MEWRGGSYEGVGGAVGVQGSQRLLEILCFRRVPLLIFIFCFTTLYTHKNNFLPRLYR